ncbi:MAG: LPS export ABC transporter periplasmic protein LptC [Methylotenera sp.]|nr:LPS export ABC transporter periplasmic protein LptC [Methylotenera sp.]
MTIGTRSAIIYPVVLLSLIGLLTAWISHMVQPPEPKLDGSSRHDPDYIMSNFVTTQTDKDGNLRYKLAAVEMKHFPDDDTTELQHPRYTQFAADKPYTQVEALRGYVSSDGEQVQLMDKVKITRQAFAGKGEMTIETEYLNILPNEDLVQTDRPVVIRQAPKTVIYATGMIYEKNIHTVTLLHKVRAHYEKPVTQSSSAQKSSGIKKATEANAVSTETNDVKSKTNQVNTTKQKAVSTLNKSSTDNARIRRRYE